jgi:hypothetical protein
LPTGPIITVYGNIVHVNFRACVHVDTIKRKDPITQKIKRVPRRFDRSDVYYTKDGRLISEPDEWVG